MATTTNFKKLIDKPDWRPVAPFLTTNGGATNSPISNSGLPFTSDMRANNYALPHIFSSASSTTLFAFYNYVKDGIFTSSYGSNALGNPANPSSACVFAPSQGAKGLLLSGNTTTKLNLDTTYLAPAAATWTRSGTTVTVTTSRPHGFYTNQRVSVNTSSDITALPLTLANNNLPPVITVTSTTTFTFTGLNAGATSGTCKIGIPFISNILNNKGDDTGYIIRVIGNSSGGSGKIEERKIISNSGLNTATTLGDLEPTVYLDKPLSFTPQTGDSFELLSGKYYIIAAGATQGGMFRSYEPITANCNPAYSMGGNMNHVNLVLAASIGQSTLISMDEQHVPSTNIPGEGFVVGASTYDTATLTGVDYINTKRCLLATATTSSTLTGQASGGDATLLANEYRNYQIRIVEDTATPTAVGQRRRISSHTAGASPVYTLSANWTVTPSATCKFVIENWTDNMILTVSGSTTIFNYKVSNLCLDTEQTIDTWSTTKWGTLPAASMGVGFQPFGYSNTLDKSFRNSYITIFGATSIFTLDISGGATGAILPTKYNNILANTTSQAFYFVYNPFTENGDYVYAINGFFNLVGNSHLVMKYEISSTSFYPYSTLKAPVGIFSGTGFASNFSSSANRMAIGLFQDGTTRIPAVYTAKLAAASPDMYELLLIN